MSGNHAPIATVFLFGGIGGAIALVAIACEWWRDPVGLWSTLLTLTGMAIGAAIAGRHRTAGEETP